MKVEPLRPEDAEDVMAIAQSWDAGLMTLTPGAHGAVVREAGTVVAYALLRECGYGFVVDELYCTKARPGYAALAELARWLEETVARIAADRGLESLPLGGIAKLDNPRHRAALEHRGYQHVANVYAKDIVASYRDSYVSRQTIVEAV